MPGRRDEHGPTLLEAFTTHRRKPLSRRGFLQAAGGTLAASLTPRTPASAQVPAIKLPETPAKQIGFALVGLGSLAINQLMPAFARCRLAKLVGFVSGRPEKARQLAQVYGVDPKNISTSAGRRTPHAILQRALR